MATELSNSASHPLSRSLVVLYTHTHKYLNLCVFPIFSSVKIRLFTLNNSWCLLE